MIVAVDGPSGSGKSTVSRRIAERYGLIHIDTGAMYRAVALKASEAGIDPADHEALGRLARETNISFFLIEGVNRTLLDGRDVSEAIRAPEISLLTSKVAAVPAVREAMVGLQRKMAETVGVVMDGRDIGTVVFPNADYKFFLGADLEERAKRRHLELSEKQNSAVSRSDTLADMAKRDEADSNRKESPMKMAADAFFIDTTHLTLNEVLEAVEHRIDEGGKKRS